MRINIVKSNAIALVSAASLLALAGCSGTTYGTGVTQEQQLVTDISGLITIGSRQKREPIDYSARPGLVKAPSGETLPPPAEKIESDSGYFPQNNEDRRRALRNEADNADEVLARGGKLSPELEALRAQSRQDRRDRMRVAEKADQESYAEIVAKREQYEAQKIRREGVVGPKTRQYLTQPPTEYNEPAETAPVGVVGERERDPSQINKPPRKSIFKRIFG